MELVSLIFDALFVFLIIINSWLTNKSIDRLERKVKELEEKNNFKDVMPEEKEVKPVARKKRVRKPKEIKHTM